MSSPMNDLLAAGQSVWLDNLRRSMFASGELARLIESGLRGMTSNPTIFEKAIGTGNDYDAQLQSLIGTQRDPDALFWDLAIEDIQHACDAFHQLYESSEAGDGYVSLEVSPLLAADTAGTIAMAKDLWKRVNRPNLMVKIPGTNEGIAAIEECIYAGINVNVTLIFAIEMYEKTARAYIRGLERRLADGKPITRIRSVNSVFVSRIDTAVDKLLEARIAKGDKLTGLLGKAGIANLKLTYAKFKELFLGDAFAHIASAGGHPQRPLWASTSTKNPAYPDLLYVDTVVGKHTVNTMPPNTLDALLDHGKIVPDTVESNLEQARSTMQALADAQISFFEVTHQLQIEGVQSFSDSFVALQAAIAYKRDHLATGKERVALSLGSYANQYNNGIESLVAKNALTRLWSHDASLWSDAPEHRAIIEKSLGWLDIAARLHEEVPKLQAFANTVRQSFSHVVVLGMGGSSLAPDILHDTFGNKHGYPTMHVLDSTDPQQIAELEAALDIARTLFIVASKSGTTTEPDAFYRYFHARVSAVVGAAKAGGHFVAITDPGTQLAAEAKSNGFLACYENDANIGGRYSALSYVGILPSALCGYDIALLLDRAIGAMHENDRSVAASDAPAIRFGAAIGSLAKAGRDKLTIITHPTIKAFGAWCEQLIAESTGKLGTGIIPIESEPLGAPAVYGDDRLFVYVGSGLPNADAADEAKLAALEAAGHPIIRLAMNDAYDLGEQFLRWEMATAFAGVILGIDAFDQPNVQESKDNTKALLSQFATTGKLPQPSVVVGNDHCEASLLKGSLGVGAHSIEQAIASVLAQLKAGDYLTFSAYVARNETHEHLLQNLRTRVRDAKHVATTVGFGPRFLHSTGQLHKGGPDSVLTVQIVHDSAHDPMIPGMHVGFRTLIAAQSLGDWQSLDSRNRRGIRIHIIGDLANGLRDFTNLLEEALASRV